MKTYRRFSTQWQLLATVSAFVVVGLVVESGGLLRWAERLELGPERTVALPLATGLHDHLARLGVERLRRSALVELARIGWSDDPAALAEAAPAPAPAPPSVTPSVIPPPPATAAPAITKTTAPPPPPSPSTAAPLLTPGVPKPMPSGPPRISHLPAMPPVPTGTRRTVVLAGDSMMAVGLSSTILRQAPQHPDLQLVKAFKSGTGLARPEVFDWATEYPAMLKTALPAGTRPDIVLVAIGANDGQGFVDGGTTYPFGTAAWQTIYKARVQAYLSMLEADGATVVWLGLPPMKSDTYDAHTALINRIDYAVVSASPHAIWYSTTGLYGDAAGKFLDYGTVHGITSRLRQEDGIHISDAGGALLADALLPWLEGSK
jgi:lysophospholipase L1-like esterase